ncbi:MAG: phosphotransferase [Oscillospiraceae bacterium]|nr:phosphotransferase [Oscillospiraceae bacterium]
MSWKHVPGSETFKTVKPLAKGWSGAKKFIVTTADDQQLLLRLSSIDGHDSSKAEFEKMARVATCGVPSPTPIDFGVCRKGKQVYSLVTWLEGNDVGSLLPTLPEAEQYQLGKQAGALLRAIHQIPAQPDEEDWSIWFERRMQEKLDIYFAHEQHLADAAPCVDYLLQNKALLQNRPQVFYHGDLNPTNVIRMTDGSVAAIDYNAPYNRLRIDPVLEFCTIPWEQNPNAHYYTGMLDGYYEGFSEKDFVAELAVLAYYFAYEAVWGMADSHPNGFMKKECRKHLENVLRWYDNMRTPIPSWYLQNLNTRGAP